jgi:membrane protein YqaA with SNARE-associated domain
MQVLETIGEIGNWLQVTLLPYGGPGLFVLAVCDSSFLSLPEVNDLLLMYFSIQEPRLMLVYASFTTAGSVVGCLMLYTVGRKGGEAVLRRRLSGERMDRFRSGYARFGILAVVIPSLLPPPTPFKVFVLSAGAFGVPTGRFLVAVLIGRSLRYFGQGVLAVLYGEAAIAWVRDNAAPVGVGLSVAFILITALAVVWRRRWRSGAQ